MFSLSFLTSLCFFDANLRIIGQTAGSAHSFFPPAVQEKFCRKKKAAYICSAQSPDGGIGRRTGLKIQRPQGCAGSTPAPGTSLSKALQSSCEAFLLFSSLHLPFPPGTIPHRLFPTSPPQFSLVRHKTRNSSNRPFRNLLSPSRLPYPSKHKKKPAAFPGRRLKSTVERSTITGNPDSQGSG